MIDHLELETSIQHDKPRGTTWYAGFRLQMQLGSSKDKPKLNGLEKQMTDFVRRDLDVVVDVGGETWTKETGAPYVGKIVSTEAELAAITGGKAKDVGKVDIIGVRGTIEVEGNAIGATAVEIRATLPAIRLNYGQSITGQGLTFTANDGKTYTVKIVNSDQGIAGADPSLVGDAGRGGITLKGANGEVGHLLQVYTNASATTADRVELEARVQRIEDLILTVPENSTGDASLGLTSSVITNVTGRMGVDGNPDSFGHVVIDHIEANSNVLMAFLATGKTGKLRLTASKFTVSEMVNAVGGMAHIYSLGENGVVIESIDNNELVSMTSVATARGLFFSYLNGPVVNNRFSSITGQNAIGVYVNYDLSGSVSGNTFSSIVATDYAYGVYVNYDLSGSVSGNTFSSIVGAGDTYGVYVNGSLSGSVSGNTFGSIVAEDDVDGIYVGNMEIGSSISNNRFDLIKSTGAGASYAADGIYISDNIKGTISDNVFGQVISQAQHAYGIYQANSSKTINIADITGNTFNVYAPTTGKTAYGLSYDGANPTLNGTIAAFKTSQNNVFGGEIGDNEVQARS